MLYKKAFYKQSEDTFVYHGPATDWLKGQVMVSVKVRIGLSLGSGLRASLNG